MQNAPIFIEAPVPDSPLILAAMRDILIRDGHEHLPFATNSDQLHELIQQVLMGSFAPSVFVVNTWGAEALLEELDLIIGDAPVVFLHPEKTAKDSESVTPRRSTRVVTSCLNQMRSPHKGIWRYNESNWMELCLRGVQRLENYFTSADPHCLEMEMTQPPIAQLQYLPNFEEQASILKQLARDH